MVELETFSDGLPACRAGVGAAIRVVPVDRPDAEPTVVDLAPGTLVPTYPVSEYGSDLPEIVQRLAVLAPADMEVVGYDYGGVGDDFFRYGTVTPSGTLQL